MDLAREAVIPSMQTGKPITGFGIRALLGRGGVTSTLRPAPPRVSRCEVRTSGTRASTASTPTLPPAEVGLPYPAALSAARSASFFAALNAAMAADLPKTASAPWYMPATTSTWQGTPAARRRSA